MDDELFNAPGLLAPSPEYLASVKVFPLIPAIKKEIIVCMFLSLFQLSASIRRPSRNHILTEYSRVPRKPLVRTKVALEIYQWADVF